MTARIDPFLLLEPYALALLRRAAAGCDLVAIARPRHARLARALAPFLLGPASADVEAERAALLRRAPELAPHVRLLDHCVAHLRDVLEGRALASDVLFPGGGMELVEQIYRGNPWCDHFNALTARAALSAVLARRAQAPNATVRLLEVGAGTGGVSRDVLAALDPHAAFVAYDYTDVSPGFVQFGLRTHGAGRGFVAGRVLDLEAAPQAQGFAPHAYDVVIGSNVLHATRRISASLAHVGELLAPGGLLLLSELTRAGAYATATFGLLDGWWAFEDEEARLPGGPVLSPEGWRRALTAAGFSAPAVLAWTEPAESSFQCLFVAAAGAAIADHREEPRPAPAPVRSAVVERGDLESLLAARLAALLGLEAREIAADRPLSEYGVDSIVAPQFVAALNQELGVDLRPSEIFDCATLEGLAARLRPALGRPASSGGGDNASSSAAPVAETDIAVIGLSCRFPGAPNAGAFWDNLLAGRCSVGAAPAGRWDGVAAEQLRRGGFLDDHDIFDPEFFNLSWREAEAMSPQQRIFLEEAWNALENAGYGRRSLAGRRCGVFVGVAPDGYGVCDNDSLSSLGGSAAILSARLSYLLDLKGPSLPVDTACSSSLVAVHLACRALLADDCEMALAGGVSVLMNEPRLHAFLDDAGMLSPTGLCRAFDASADGFAPGEGCGVLALKKLGSALADGDHIMAVIKATGINQDGRSSGITAPSGAAQTELERAVLARAGVGAERIGLVEAHGTGTQLGDPIEVAALTATFRAATERRGFCALGSVKTNIGHTLAAAGVAGLIKAILAVRAGVIPPSLHFARANPEIDFDSGPFFVPRAAQVWEASPRFAAVSSFGFSGTNAHAIIGEAPSLPVTAEALGRALILLSARSEEALAARRRDLADWLDTHRPRLADLAFTLAHGRSHFEHRQALVAASLEEVAQWLRRAEAGAAVALPARAESAELAALLAAPVRDLDRLADCYSRGGDGDWSLLAAPGARRLALPGYPFARIRFPTRRLPSGLTPPAPASHPLLAPGSAAGDAVRLAIHAEASHLEAHRFGGAALLPAATLIEIIRAAASRALGRPVARLSELRFEAPLRAGAEAAIHFERNGAFFLRSADGTLHAKGFVGTPDESEPDGARSDARPGPRAFRLASRGEEEGRRFTRQAVYAAFAELGFDYGPSLRVIRSLRADAQEALAELEPQAPCDPSLMLDPALLDGAIQAAIGTMMAGSENLRAVLPVGVDEVIIHAPLRSECCAHVAMRRTGEDSRSLDSLLVDPDGHALVELRGVALRVVVATMADRDCLAFAPVWEPRPLAPAEPPRALLLFDRDETLWRRLGDAAILVRPGTGFCRLEERCFAVDPASAEDYRRLVDLLRNEGRLPAAVWHLWSRHPQPRELRGLDAEAVAAELRLGLGSVALLAAALAATTPASTTLIHAFPAGGLAALHEPAAAFGAALARENPLLRVAAVAIGDCDEAGLVAALARETAALSGGWPQTGWAASWPSAGERLICVFREIAPPAAPPLREGAVYLLTGALGGVGKHIARRLAREGARLALIGRAAPGPANEALIAEIRAAGGDALYLRADVTDFAQVEAVAAAARARFGRIDGVLHAAGTTRDKFLIHKAPEDVAAVLAPKLLGALALDRATAGDDLDVFVLFSSLAGSFGNEGQTDYAAANRFLDGFAATRRGPGRTLSIGWPFWREGGLSPGAEELARRLDGSGLRSLETEEALDLFARYAAGAEGAVLLLPAARETVEALLGAAPAPSARAGGTVDETLAMLRSMLARATAMPEERIHPDRPLENYGIDSLLVSRMNGELAAIYPRVPKTLLFEHRTLRSAAAFLSERFGPISPPPREEAPPAPAATAPIEGIAIIGMAGRYPGADNLDAFWENLCADRDLIVEIPPERWPVEGFYDPQIGAPGRSYSKWGGFLSGVDGFDPLFFSIAPGEAAAIDPNERLFLETCWEALENAGHTRASLAPAPRAVGVYVGVMYGDYGLLAADAAAPGRAVGGAAPYWSIANRISYWFDLHGPSLAVDSACSSSLTAIHLACQALACGEISAAIAGGVNLSLHPLKYVGLSQGRFAASDGRCHSFTEGGDGYAPGEGVGAVILKPLAAALADGDHVHAVIRGWTANHGGKTNGYTVPNPQAQGEAITAALARAGVPVASVSYVEAHGTGTALGDPIEVAGLVAAFGEAGACALGSLKANIGHLEAAAGVAALTRVALQMRHRILTPTRMHGATNPNIDFAATPFRLQHRLEPWTGPLPLRAGVSSFGAGGANAHLVVEAFEPAPAASADDAPRLFLLSARTEAQLRAYAERMAEFLRRTDVPFVDVCRTLQIGRETMAARLAFVARSGAEAAALLAAPKIVLVEEEGAAPPARADLEALARAFLAGAPIDWRARSLPGKRAPLPPHPFMRRHYWIEQPARLAPATLHPFLDAILPSLDGARFTKRFTPRDAIVRDHRVQGRLLVPGVVQLEMARAAAERAGLPCETLSNIVWSTPLEVPDEGIEIAVTLRRAEQAARFQISGPAGETFCRGEIGAGVEPVETTRKAERAATRTLEAPRIFAALAALGLDYGPSLRRLTTIEIGGDRLLARIEPPDAAPGVALPPDALDSALQALIGFADEAAERLFVPFSLSRLARFGDLARARRILAERRAGGEGVVAFDLSLCDESGVVLARLEHLAARPRPARGAEPLPLTIRRPVWTAEPLGAATTAARAVLLAHGSDDLGLAEAFGKDRVVSWLWRDDPAALPDLLQGRDLVWIAAGDGEPAAEAEAMALALLRAAQALDRAGRLGGGLRLFVVTRDLHRLTPRERPDPRAGALVGLAKSLALEYPGLAVALIDFDAASLRDFDPARLLGESALLPAQAVAWRRGVRHVEIMAPYEPPAPTPPVEAGTVVMIVGGAGGIGLALGAFLARECGARVALLGRRPFAEVAARLAAQETGLGELRYVEADATDRAAMDRAVAELRGIFGRIDAAIHAALVLRDLTIARMDEATFRAVLAPKLAGAVNLAEALSGESLRFLAFLSSVNVVSGSRGQSNYVAGSSFVDAYAAALAAEKPWRVITTDWGLWGEIGIVSGDAYRDSLARQGVHPIRPAEGIAVLASVLAGTEDRVAILRAEPAALLRLGIDREAASGVGSDSAPIEAPFAALERYGRTVLCRHLGEMGADGKAFTFEGLRRRLGVAERHKTLLAALLEALAGDALIEARDGLWRLAREAPDVEAARRALDAAESGAPWLAGPRRLLQACLDAYPALLRGEVDPVAILFPEASMRLVEAAYADHPLADRFNRLVAAEVAAAAETSAAPLRVLEIGAGTGSTTAAVLDALTRPVDYVSTDVSQRFASHGRARFGERPGLRFSILDIERDEDIEAAGAGGFDIALAANVLHATADLTATLRRVKRLLRPGGRLLLSEATRASDFGTLVFGLTPGWWRAADRQSGRRIPFSPLCSVGAWRELITEAGFAAVRAIGAEEADPPHALLIAENEASAARAPSPVDVAARLQDHLRGVLADVLKVDAEEIRLKESFDRYGLESLTALEVRNRLDPDFPGLPATLLFEQSTLARLADFLLSTHGERVALLFASRPDARAGAGTAPLPAAPQRREAAEEPIAIIGFAGRYPGGADPARFWELLRSGASAIREVPPERWNADASFDPAGGDGRSYTKWAGFLDGDIGAFDPLFFSLSPLEAEAMDPQERLFLETAWTTLEQAGYAPERLRRAAARACPQGGDVGVFVGAMNVPYQWVAAEAVAAGHANAASTNFWSIANRISHLLDFSGPSLVVDTACSASLTAIHLACESLRRGECGAALAGGVNLILHPRQLIHLSQARMVSHGRECRAFGAGADGFVDGEGVGAVLLKPLGAAIRDGDRIEAVILGSAINSGGRSSGFTAPNPQAQAKVIRAALARAGVSPETIDVVEAHGTGTALGDPIEIGALREVFAARAGAPSAIGALKANIGHLESAAGIAGLTKLLLQFRHETIAPLRHAAEPNPLLALDDARLVLPAAPLPWPARETPRRAGLSSFGAGGANAHLVIEDHPAPPRAAPRPGADLVILSARDADRLRVMTKALVERLRSDPPRLDDIAHTLRVGRQAMDARLAVVATDVADLSARLSGWLAGAEHGVLFAAAPETSAARWSEGEEGRAEIARLLAVADLPELARRWVAGAEVDWSDLAGVTDARLVELPSYPFRRERHWLPTPPAPEPRREKQAPQRSAEPARIELLTREWRPRPADHRGAARPVAVLAPDGALAAALAPLWPAAVYVLRPAPAFAVVDARTIELNPLAPGDLEATLDHLARSCPEGFAIVQASGLSKAPDAQDRELHPRAEGARRAGALTTLMLTQAAQRSGLGELRILHVFDVAEARPLDCAVGALARSANQESHSVRLRAIGVAGAVETAEAARICREELFAEDECAEILREAGRRLHPVVAPAATDEAEETIGFRVGGAYLLAGGLGEVGCALAERLGRDYRARIAILGRSDPRGAARERLDRLEAQGVRVHYVACDLTDTKRLRAAFAEIESRIGKLHGVVHLARTVEDGLLAHKPLDSVERVLSAKVDGTLALDAALADTELDWFVLCSSLASWTGLPGGADYAFACGFQNAFARLRESRRRAGSRSGRSVAICWPQWEHDRFLDEAKRARLAAEGLETIDARDGLRILLDAVRSGRAEVAALKGGAEAIRRLTAAPAAEPDDPVLAELRALDEDTLHAFLAYLDAPAAETRPAPRNDAAATLIRDAIGDFLKLPREKLLPESAFADLGLDSIKALHLAERLQKRLGVAIDPVMFHESPTLARFSASVAARLARPDARAES